MRRQTMFWGIVLIIAGILFLVANFAGLNAWALLWPVFLILLGGWILWSVLRRPEEVETQTLNVPLEGAVQASLKISYGAGKIEIAAGTSSDLLLAGEFGGGVIPKVAREADLLRVKLHAPQVEGVFPWQYERMEGRRWNLLLNPAVPLKLKLDTGACEVQADLRELRVTDLAIDTGASSTTVTLPAHAGLTRVRVQGGAASVKLRVPEGVAASIHSGGGLSSTRVSAERFPRSGDRYVSPDYDTAENKVEINAEMGVGSVEIY